MVIKNDGGGSVYAYTRRDAIASTGKQSRHLFCCCFDKKRKRIYSWRNKHILLQNTAYDRCIRGDKKEFYVSIKSFYSIKTLEF